jgi:hypothetical protein
MSQESIFSVDAFLDEAKALTPATLVPFAVKIATAANKLADKSGAEKKELVLASISSLLEKCKAAAPEDAEKWVRLDELQKELLPSVLDTAVAVARGKFDLGRTAAAVAEVVADPKVASSCLALLCSLLPVEKKNVAAK